MREAKAFAPGHLTGLFQICTEGNDPLRWGARGSGVSLTRGVTTHVSAEPSGRQTHDIYINDEQVIDAYVSEYVLSKYQTYLIQPMNITIRHTINTPLTAGFGSSGGGALSLSLALNEALQIGLSSIDAAQIAHIAEIECKTGLGSVFAAVNGGFGVLYEPGAPGIGKGILMQDTGDLAVVYVYYGPIHTKDALSNPDLVKKINQLGRTYVDELYKELTAERFMYYSRKFTDHVGLATKRIRGLFKQMDSHSLTFTMANFGEVSFTVQHKASAEQAVEILEGLGEHPVICPIDEHGATLL
ncbi:MAG: GHMP kinase [Candidatus Bathyarchaeota archaeon]